jgi:hypothetical protein
VGDEGSIFGGDLGNVVTPRDLINDVATYSDDKLFLVGRYVGSRTLSYDMGHINEEFHVADRSGRFHVYIGTDDVIPLVLDSGDPVYAHARLAAIGESETTSRRKLPTAYVLAIETTEISEVTERTGSAALRDAARKVMKPGNGLDSETPSLPFIP